MLCVLFAVLVYVIFQFQSSYNDEELALYFCLLITYIWIALLLSIAEYRFGIYFFEPITIITLLYIGIFIIKPLIDLKTNSFYEHGVYVFNGGIKATSIIALSYTIFFFSYYGKHCSVQALINKIDERKFQWKRISTEKLYFAWCICYILCLVCMFSQGMSINYIFSLGNSGIRIRNNDNIALLFLSNFAITTVSLWLLIIIKSKSLIGKIIITVFEVTYLLTRNGRWLILVLLLAPIVYHFEKSKKSPRIASLALIGVLFLAIFAWMQVNRHSLATGGGYSSWSSVGMNLEKFMSPFESDFNTYRTFYSMVKRFPDVYPYMNGSTYLYIFILLIPRAIWKTKPINPVTTMIQLSLNTNATIAGTVTCNIGEMYANFGIIGCILGMYLTGIFAGVMRRISYCDDDYLIIMHSILFPLWFQWVARGSFSGNVFTTLFAILPILFIRKNTGKRFVIVKRGKDC